MGKINFTEEHFTKMCDGLLKMLLENKCVVTKLGSPLNVVELLHTTTIGTLNSIRMDLGKRIEKLEAQDEWSCEESTQQKLESIKSTKEIVNLIIGYKRYILEQEEIRRKKVELKAAIDEIVESQKSPEDKLNELKAELSSLDEVKEVGVREE